MLLLIYYYFFHWVNDCYSYFKGTILHFSKYISLHCPLLPKYQYSSTIVNRTLFYLAVLRGYFWSWSYGSSSNFLHGKHVSSSLNDVSGLIHSCFLFWSLLELILHWCCFGIAGFHYIQDNSSWLVLVTDELEVPLNWSLTPSCSPSEKVVFLFPI